MATYTSKKPEVLSPCGGMESLYAALRSGADAVYVGGKSFSARRGAVNFTADELKEAVRECHRYGVLIYQAINTVALDSELEALAAEIKTACDTGVDGIIVQDLATMAIAKAACPDMPLHASTQMTIHTVEGVLQERELGFSRCVVARELPLDTISELCKLDTEIEAFVHGALCMSVSGQCYLSAMIGSRSANRGGCAGACRLPFFCDKRSDDKYALSLKDMSYASHAKELCDAGVASLKIEGRMKRPEYVAAATDAIRKAVDGEKYDTDRLRAIFSRSGFTDGYLTKKLGAEMFGARVKEDVTGARNVIPELRELYRAERKKFKVSFDFSAVESCPVSLTASDGENSVTVYGENPQIANNRPTEAEAIIKQLSKLGGTVYDAGEVSAHIGRGLMVPLSAINELRRNAIAELDEKRIETLTKIKDFKSEKLSLRFPQPRIRKIPRLRVSVQSVKTLALMDINDIEYIILPLSQAGAYLDLGYDPEKAILSLPRYMHREADVINKLEKAKELGFNRAECTNIAHIRICKSFGILPFGGFGLNITNSLSASEYEALGLREITLSYELKATQMNRIHASVPVGFLAYGKLPLMLTVNCPIAAQVGCKSCTGMLTDRTGAQFPISCHKDLGYYELLNSAVLHLEDRMDDFNLDFATLYFTDESPEEAQRVVKNYREGVRPNGEYTKGLYYRGIE